MLSTTVVRTYHLFKERWRDPVVRRNAGYLLMGKMIGLGIVLFIISRCWVPANREATFARPG